MTQGVPEPPLTETDLSGRRLGEYAIVRRLGRGAMAEVYLAEQPALKRQVAVKVLRPHLAADETYVARFRIEAQAAAALVHGNIVQIHDVGCAAGIHYIALEYVAGQTLGQILARRRVIDPASTVLIMRQTALALHKAAAAGIVHRDIKPENIMLTRSGEVKVADFGLALLGGSVGLTQAGVTLGTPLYMSPEQVEGRPLDPRSDIYSLGCTAYHLLAGRPPFEADTPLGVAMQHLKKQPERLENLRPELPPALCRIVHRMLAKDPGERYPSSRELLLELRQLPAMPGPASLSVDGLTINWAEADLDEVDAAVLDGHTSELNAATQRLAAVMSRERPSRGRWAVVGIVAAVLLSFAAGMTLRAAMREPFLLGERAASIPQQATAAGQWLYAESVNTEEAWQAVERYFPDERNRVQHLRARQRLGRLYLNEALGQKELTASDVARYGRPFAELAALTNPADREFRAYGLSGQFVLLCLENKHQQARQLLGEELMPLLGQLREEQLPDNEMRQIVRYAQQRNARELNEKEAAELTRRLEERFGGDLLTP